jgi:hypothetical protein
MGISPRALGGAATARFDLGLRRTRTETSWIGDDERRRAAAVLRLGKGGIWMRYGRNGVMLENKEWQRRLLTGA